MDMQTVQQEVTDWAKSKGWHDEQLSNPNVAPSEVERFLALIALAHLDLSHLAEKVREGYRMGLAPFRKQIAELEAVLDQKNSVNVVKVLAKLALVHTEVSEASQAVCDDAIATEVIDGKPEGLGSELADIHIRVFHLEGMLGLESADEVEVKMEYNQGRPFKHGKLA